MRRARSGYDERTLDARIAGDPNPIQHGSGLYGRGRPKCRSRKQLSGFPQLGGRSSPEEKRRDKLKKGARQRPPPGEAFLLQGGVLRAESFWPEHFRRHIRDFFRVFLQMAVVLTLCRASSPAVGEGVGALPGPSSPSRRSAADGDRRRGVRACRAYPTGGQSSTASPSTPASRQSRSRIASSKAYRQSAATLKSDPRLRNRPGYANSGRIRASLVDASASSGQPAILAPMPSSRSRFTQTIDFMRAIRDQPRSSIRRCASTTSLHQPRGALLLGY